MPPIVRKIVKNIGAGIGAGREAYDAHKHSKEDRQNEAQSNPGIHVVNAIDVTENDKEKEDEIAWELDEAQELVDPTPYDDSHVGNAASSGGLDDLPKLIQEILQRVGPYSSGKERMPYPIVIPQRRPRSKRRGFIRAYPPILENYGINQDAFFTILQNFDEASKPSKYIMTVFVAGNLAGNIPSIYAMAVSMAVQVASGTALEFQRRYRTNTFLNQMNEAVFKPRGLFALIMCYKPYAIRPIEMAEVSASTLVAQHEEKPSNSLATAGKKFKFAEGKTYSEAEFGEVAPLVYPSLDAAAADPNSNAFKKASNFLAEYSDKRAQAVYKAQHAGSALGNPQEINFVSRYSDPNHSASSGSLISLLTGGHVNPVVRRDQRTETRNEWKSEHRAQRPIS
jgi:hypothetical protein